MAFHLIIFSYLLCMPFLILAYPISEVRNMSIHDYIDYVNPPPVHKYKHDNGDTILCVNFTDQISLRPANQQYPGYNKNNSNMDRWRNTHPAERHSNISNSGVDKRCPQGTISVREIKYEHVKEAGSVNMFLRKKKLDSSSLVHEVYIFNDKYFPLIVKRKEEVVNIKFDPIKIIKFCWAWCLNLPNNFILKCNLALKHAIVQYNSTSEGIYGAQARYNIWEPHVAPNDAFSLSQIWLVQRQPITQTVEAGWEVFPDHYGDSRPRLFVYWTNDDYQSMGCRNVECPGFVMSNGAENYVGQPMDQVSQYGQYVELLLSIKRETLQGAAIWSLYIKNKSVGYWLGSLFSSLAESTSIVQYGGEVAVSTNATGTPFSKTHMGSGHFPQEGFSKAAYIKDIQMQNSNNALIYPEETIVVTKPLCYNSTLAIDNTTLELGHYIFFGGPGGDNPSCLN